MDTRPTTRGGPLYWLWRRSWQFWIAVGVVMSVLYVAGFGPACWLAGVESQFATQLYEYYRPLVLIAKDGPTVFSAPLVWYADTCGGGPVLKYAFEAIESGY
ncbi:MAG TPA: hypothetical protein VGM05_33685 [Planctomycetaceae bacterium]|jgi:hypothetical protein